jgi:hypothetical protein
VGIGTFSPVSGPNHTGVLVPAARILIAAILALVGLTACGDDAGPEPAPLEAARPSESAIATEVTPPVMPAAAMGGDALSAKAFVRYWVATFNYATATGDTASLRRLGSRHCQSCRSITDRIDKVYRSGGRIKSAGWRASKLRGPSERSIISATLLQSAQDVWESGDADPTHFPGGTLPVRFFLSHQAAGWRLEGLAQVS